MPRSKPQIETSRISLANLEGVTSYLPRLRNIGSKGAFLAGISGESHYARLVGGLMRALDENNFVQPFNWVSWQPRGVSYYRNKKKIRSARLETCVKLLTLHVRKDRYCANHFGLMIMEGHVQAILSRLLRLRGNL
jgi:Family of unknown function (DUF6508)